MNCWEFMGCGYVVNGNNGSGEGTCPAYPSHGRHCARITGTLCGGSVQGKFSMKLAQCIRCSYYQSEHYDKSYRSLSRV